MNTVGNVAQEWSVIQMAEYDLISKTALLEHLGMAMECENCPRNADKELYKCVHNPTPERCTCSDIAQICIRITEFATFADVQPVKRGRWITKAEDYYKAWQDSGRSWDDMPYFVTGLKFACSNCFEQFDVNAEGVEKWSGCPLCLARMDGEQDE